MRTDWLGLAHRLSLLLVPLLFVACGGGGGGNSPPPIPLCSNFVSIDPNSTTAGVLQSGDCTMATLVPGSGDNSFVDLYRVALPTSGTLTVALNSTTFDAFLLLLSEDLQTLINVDDDSGGPPNARIQMPIGAGTYVVLANSFNAGESGPYTLTLTFVADVWQPTSLTNAPETRTEHTAVWTGSEMIVWGGHDGNSLAKSTGARFNPATNTWTPISTIGAPSSRWMHTAIWTGTEMIIWGGFSGFPQFLPLGDGAKYNLQTNTWAPITGVAQPSARINHTAVWTGTEMIVWGGFTCPTCPNGQLNTGARYDPVLNSWTATATGGAPAPRAHHTAIWTGTRMIVWGGNNDAAPGPPVIFASGGIYDPAADNWLATSLVGAPPAARCHSSVWTGLEMIVFGGQTNTSLACGISSTGTGTRYVPATDTWNPMSSAPVSSTLSGAPAVWTGSQLITWFDNTGARYNFATDIWNGISSNGAPTSRRRHSLIWTGSRLIVWGGDFAGTLNTGGIYNPSVDTTP